MSRKKAAKRTGRRLTKRRAAGRRVGQASRQYKPLPGSSHVTSAGGNLFADLGFSPHEAQNLKLRAQLMMELRAIIEGMPQAQAARLLDVSQPRISHLSRGKIGLFTIDTLVNMLAHAGAQLRVSVRLRR